MADPFGIIGVIGVAGQIIQLTVKLSLDWKDVPDDTKRFLAEIRTLKTVLSETYTNIISNDDFKNAFHGRHSTLLSQLGNTAGSTNTSVLISACNQELTSLLDDLKKQGQGHRVGWERLKGAFLATKTREAVENLQRQCRTLNGLVDIDALALAVQTHKEVTETRKQHQAWQTDRENKAVLDWITTVDYSTQQSDIFRRRQLGTGQWLLDSAEYHQWADTSQKTLFCPGIPGAGKTILTSIIVDDLHTRFRDDEHVGIAFLYCNFKRQAEQKAEDLLSSVLQQLAQDQASLPECVRSLHDKHKGKTRPTLEELSTALQIVAKQFSRIFIVVDALDECQLSDGCQSKFLTELFALQNTSGANIFASSRFIQNITDRFKGTISLEIRAHPEDVRRYLQGHMAHMPACLLRSPDLQDEIITTIVKAVDGMFLLARLHLNSLAGKKSPKAIRRSLATLHTGSDAYDHAYGAAMERIEGQIKGDRDLAKQVLSWVTCSKRPLSTTELQHALSVEVGETELDLQNVSEIEDIISVCAGLVTIDEESSIIRLVHYTTQEYFMRTWKQRFPDAQMEITEVCATYLSFCTFDGGFCRTDTDFEERLQSRPLYDYAGHFWGDHAREAGKASRVVTRLLKNDMHIEAHVQVLMTVKRSWGTSYSLKFVKRMRGLHIAAYFGIKAATRDLLDGSDSPDITDESGRTPLSWAARNGHDAVVKLLFDTGQVDVDSKDKEYGQTPLSWAARNGHDAVVKLLLDTGQVDVNSKGKGFGQTPLSWAAENGHNAVVKLLLGTGQVDVDSKGNNGRTPLSWAAERGHDAVVKLLLDTGQVDVDSKGKGFGQTPLSWAAENGHDAVVKLLLGTGQVDVDSKGNNGQTPLSWAAENGHDAVVKLLLGTGQVDVDSKGNNGRTPLSWAAENGHDAVVKLLLGTGQVDVDSKGNNGRTPLSWAAKWGHNAVVKLLLDTGQVDIDSKDNIGRTPLSLAAENGDDAVVKLLLDTGQVDVDSKDEEYGQTPLSWAAKNGHDAVVKLLLDTGQVDVDSKGKGFGQTPLSWAAENGHNAVVKLLLGTGQVDVDSKGNNGRTPLSWAAGNGHDAVVKLLLDTGQVDVDSKDEEYGQTPLSWAAENGHDAVVKLLLDTGQVDVDSKGKGFGQTPLSWAAENGHDAVVKLLLGTGQVDVDSKGNDGRTPLSWAAEWGHDAVVKLLLDTGQVDVDSKGKGFGQTPLSWAAENGHDAVVKLLLGTGQVDVDSKGNDGRTPLSWAAKWGHDAVVKLLLDTGQVDIDSKDNIGRTPLSLAAENGDDAVVKLLLDTGQVDVDSKDEEYGQTPLSWAAEREHDAVVKLLLDTGQVDVDSEG